jgi:hypothetical protein
VKAWRVAYKPVGPALGAPVVVAGALFEQAWKVLGHDEDAPTPSARTAAGGRP